MSMSGIEDFGNMKLHRMPFEYWEDEHWKILKKDTKKGEEFLDPDYYVEAHWKWDVNGHGPYFLNRRCRRLLDRDGPFVGRYKNGNLLVDLCAPEAEAFIFAPGPSFAEIDTKPFEGLVTLAVNSAGFGMKPMFWVMAESSYADWLKKQWVRLKQSGKWDPYRAAVVTARVAIVLREFEKRQRSTIFKELFVIRWEEGKVVPPRTPAVSLTNALVTAWQLGCKKAYMIGVDLSKEGGAYSKGLPHTNEGAANPFDDQIKAMKQFQLPDFEVINCSPLSKDILPFPYMSYADLLQKVTR